MSTAEQGPPLPSRDTIRDIFLWRKKKLSVAVLLISTLIYDALEIYQYRILPLVCWALMVVFSSAFLGAYLLKLVGKEAPSLSGLEVSEEYASEAARTVKEWIEESIRWMFVISVEREWFKFGRVIAGLYLLSLLGRRFDLVTVVYVGELLGFTLPIIYSKNREKLRSWTERVKMQGRRWCNMVNEKICGMMGKKESKGKKVE